jgi:hypothetical protein
MGMIAREANHIPTGTIWQAPVLASQLLGSVAFGFSGENALRKNASSLTDG